MVQYNEKYPNHNSKKYTEKITRNHHNEISIRHILIKLYQKSFPGGSDVKNPPEMWETWVWSLGWEDLLEEGMAIHSSILAWGIPRTEKLSGLQSLGSQRIWHDWATKHISHFKRYEQMNNSILFIKLSPDTVILCKSIYKFNAVQTWNLIKKIENS